MIITNFFNCLFFHNDLFYMDKSEFKLTNLFDRAFVLPMHPTGYGNEQRSFYSYDREENTQLETSAYLLGPSLMLSYNQHAFAISTALRMHSNVLNISPEMSNIMAYGFEYYMPSMLQQFELNDFKAAAMAKFGIQVASMFITAQ